MATTIKDIARELNISVSTVSYALHGGARKVPDELRERVRQTAVRLNYRANRVARSLVTGRANAIGIVPPDLDDDVFLSPFVSLAWNGIVNEAEHLKQDLLLMTGSDRTSATSSFTELVDSRIDGLLFIAPRMGAKPFEILIEHRVPFAVMCASEAVAGVHYGVDNKMGVRLAMDHLVGLGHRRIAHLAGPEISYDGTQRRDVFIDCVRDNGLDVFEDQVLGNAWTRDEGNAMMQRLLALPNPPTAVFAANDDLALGAMQAAAALGVAVPGQLSIVGFDDVGLASHLGLTTIKQPIAEMAAKAMRAVLMLVEGEHSPKSDDFAPTLVVRESTGPIRR